MALHARRGYPRTTIPETSRAGSGGWIPGPALRTEDPPTTPDSCAQRTPLHGPASTVATALSLPWHVLRASAGAARADVRVRDQLVALVEGWRGDARALAHAVWSLGCARVVGDGPGGLLVEVAGTYLRDGAGCSRRRAYAAREALVEASGAYVERGPARRSRVLLWVPPAVRAAACAAALVLHARGALAEPLRGGGESEAPASGIVEVGELAPGRCTIRCPAHDDARPSLHALIRPDGTGGARCLSSSCGARYAIRRGASGAVLVPVSPRVGTSTEDVRRPEPSSSGVGEILRRDPGLAIVRRTRRGAWATRDEDLPAALERAERNALASDEEDRWITVDAQDWIGRDRRGRSRWRRGYVGWVLFDLDGETGPDHDAWAEDLAAALPTGGPWSGRVVVVRTSPGGIHVAAELRHRWSTDAVGRGGTLRPRVEEAAVRFVEEARAAGFGGIRWDHRCSGTAIREPGWRTLDDGDPFRVRLLVSAGWTPCTPPDAIPPR